MAVEVEFQELYESEVYIAPRNGAPRRDGKRTWGAQTPVWAHIETRNMLVRTTGGEERTVNGRVFLDDVYVWADEDTQLTLPDGTTPEVVSVQTTYGPNLDDGGSGPYQTVLYFGSA